MMKTKIIFILLCFLSLNVMGQGVITRNKCNTCGKVISRCPYKGKHPAKPTPKPTPTPKPKPKPTPKPAPAKPKSGTLNGHEWVDLGLSVKWATCNVGASSPSDYGGYYAWGETSTKSRYDWDNCFDCLDSTGDSWGTYKIGGQTRITPSSGHDTARENWGGTWRMPTDAENEELCSKCKWTWTSKNGHNGFTVTGPNGNSIFLPAAGCRNGADSDYVGEVGLYWLSTLNSSDSGIARILYFDSSVRYTSGGYRVYGRSVRPVTD